MDIFDPHIREEIVARLEHDPTSLALRKVPAWRGCVVFAAIAAAFACGFAAGAWCVS